MPLRRYFDFSGRSRRMEYWMFVVFQVLVALALVFLMVLGSAAGGAGGLGGEPGSLGAIGIVLLIVFWLAMVIPTIAVTVRRLHDQNLSGWFYLLNFVPVANLVLLVFMFIDGTPGENRFGPDPKGRGAYNTFS